MPQSTDNNQQYSDPPVDLDSVLAYYDNKMQELSRDNAVKQGLIVSLRRRVVELEQQVEGSKPASKKGAKKDG